MDFFFSTQPELIFGITVIILAVGAIIFFVIRAQIFSRKAGSIKIGMTYREVANLLGRPKSVTNGGGIMVCTWSRAVIRGVTIDRIVTFKENKVISVGGHTSWS